MSSDTYIINGIKKGTIKLCPFCGVASELASGCNYVTCFCKGGFNKKSEWCWVYVLAKYYSESRDLACNDKYHNSY